MAYGQVSHYKLLTVLMNRSASTTNKDQASPDCHKLNYLDVTQIFIADGYLVKWCICAEITVEVQWTVQGS